MYCHLRRCATARQSAGRSRTDRHLGGVTLTASLRATRLPCGSAGPGFGGHGWGAAPHPGEARDVAFAGADERGQTLALLEAAAIALGAADLSDESIRAARLADHQLRTSQDTSCAARLARLFHHTLLGACPNRHMLAMIDLEALDTPATPSAGLARLGGDEAGRVADDHDAILDMIAAGAPRRELERSLRRHTSESMLCSLSLRAD